MFAPQFGRMVGCCIALCVLLIFFFPLVQGPFQATHGPTTEFRASRAALAVFHTMGKATGSAFASHTATALPETEISKTVSPNGRKLPLISVGLSTLRC
jgi:hypothetical protein